MRKRIKSSDTWFYIVIGVVMFFLTIIVLYPIVYIVSASFSSSAAVTEGRVWLWPVDFSLEAYKAVFNYSDLWIGYRNTIFYVVVGTIMNVAVEMICAYPLARKDLWGKSVISFLFTFTMLFGGGMIPNYLLVKSMGMLNTPWALLIPGLMSVYNVIVARTFIQNNIPEELLEAAQIDGCNDTQFFFKMVLPLSKAIIAVLTLWHAVGHWNSYFSAFLYITEEKLYPLQVFLKEILVQSNVNSEVVGDVADALQMQNLKQLLKYAIIVVSTVPLFAFYPFVQKHFVKGVTIGSVKG
jgi:multiple sugar transport system permease protein/putative aldouronate transport system permease protein